jgi:hypothetical protein
MVFLLKQNVHQATPKDLWFIDQEKLYQKETCDVQYQYRTIFPLSSNKKGKSNGQQGAVI